MTTNRVRAFALTLVLVAGFTAVWKLQQGIDAQFAALHSEEDDLLLRSGKLVKVLSLEYAPFMADVYWTRAVQYYGNKMVEHDTDVRQLWPLLDVATTLDPNFLVAYRFGSMFLSEPAPRGAGRPDLAIRLIERGIRENPDYWQFYEDLGFIYYFDLKDYKKAGESFLEGSKNPHAQVWMKVLAAKVMEQGESRETSAFLWSEIYRSSTDPEMKKNALTHLQLLRAQMDCEQLDALAAEYEKRTGEKARGGRDLLKAGIVSRLPVDPLGYPYSFDSEGKAQLNPSSPLFREQTFYQKPLS